MSKSKQLTEKLALPTFDYGGFDPELKSKLIYLTGEINRAKSGHIKAAMAMGEAIATANDLLAEHGKYGRFGEWVERECGLGRTTAYQYMWAWNRFKGFEAVAQFDDSAMYALAAPKAPEAAADEAKKLAKKGIRITADRAKAILNSYKPKASPKTDGDCSTVEQSVAESSGKTKEENVTRAPEPPAEPSAAESDDSSTDFDPVALASAAPAKVDLEAISLPYRAWTRQLNACAAEFEGLAKDPKIGVHLHDKITRLKGYLTQAKETIVQMEPVCPCGECQGAGCNTCFGSGFWTKAIVRSRKPKES